MDRTMAKRPRSSDLLPMMNRSVAFYLLVTLCFIGCHSVIIDKPYERNCSAPEVTLPCKFNYTTSGATPPITQWRMLDTDEVVGSINSSGILNPGADFTDRIRLLNTDPFDSSIIITFRENQTTDMGHAFSCEVDIATDTDSPRKKHIILSNKECVLMVKESVLMVQAAVGVTIQCAGIVLDVLVIVFALVSMKAKPPCNSVIPAINGFGICLCVTGIVLSAIYLTQESASRLQYQDTFCWAGVALGAVGFLLGLVTAIVLFIVGRDARR